MSNVLAPDLLASRLDFIIGRVPDDLDARLFDSLAIGIEEASLIVRRGHPLLARAPVDVESLGAFEWVMQPRGTPLWRSIDALFTAHNVPAPERFSNTTSLLLTMMLVSHSDAIAPISIEAAKFAAGGGTVGALEILPTEFPIVVQPYSLIAMRNRLLSPAAQARVFRHPRGSGGARTTGALTRAANFTHPCVVDLSISVLCANPVWACSGMLAVSGRLCGWSVTALRRRAS